jgi:hypothetical protein
MKYLSADRFLLGDFRQKMINPIVAAQVLAIRTAPAAMS